MPTGPEPLALDAIDNALLTELAADGRMSMAGPVTNTGRSHERPRRLRSQRPLPRRGRPRPLP
ncbi:hypothetical protein [Streptomyces albospinus]|uniref:hypothetical protein n=1 Tax=Streptomyces albospinus TaxID=285515 RepID=UPI00167126B8|nr:hypothetical protein [Streptomyces albospinus]